jgi:hypothetical protein
VEFSETADKMSTVSTPSRRTSKKTKKKRPILDVPAAALAILASISPFIERAVLCMNQIMLTTNPAAASITQPSKMSEFQLVCASTTAPSTLAAMAEPSAQKTVFFNSGRPILLK